MNAAFRATSWLLASSTLAVLYGASDRTRAETAPDTTALPPVTITAPEQKQAPRRVARKPALPRGAVTAARPAAPRAAETAPRAPVTTARRAAPPAAETPPAP